MVLAGSTTDIDPTAAAQTNRGYWLRLNTNHLRNLASFVSFSWGIVVCSIFNSGDREMAANWMYSLTRFAGIQESLLFTFDEESLRECLTLGFACFDGRLLFPDGKARLSFEGRHSGEDYWNQVKGTRTEAA